MTYRFEKASGTILKRFQQKAEEMKKTFLLLLILHPIHFPEDATISVMMALTPMMAYPLKVR